MMLTAVRAAPVVRPGRVERVPVSIWDLLVWAFRWERVSLDFDELASVSGERPGIGIEYILMKRGDLGCEIDGGGRSEPHPDAEVVASALAVLPEALGGRRMAVAIAEFARADAWPDFGTGAARCEPEEWRVTKWGRFARRTFWTGTGRLDRWPAHVLGKDDGHVCLVRYTGTARDAAEMRRFWLTWRLALLELRTSFRIGGDLTGFVLTDELPPLEPWKKGLDRKSLR